MPSFDVVSEVDMNELTNAVDQASREIGNRYDFKGSSARVERTGDALVVYGDSEFQLEQVTDILYQKLAKRGIDVASIDAGKGESVSGDQVRVTGKKRDDLQEAIALLRGKAAELGQPLQYTNFRD